jgi:hypothetical protein
MLSSFLTQREIQPSSYKELFISILLNSKNEIHFDIEHNETDRYVIKSLEQMVNESFGIKVQGTLKRVMEADGLALLHSENEILGFASGCFPENDIFYLHGVAIAPQVKGGGYAGEVINTLRRISGLSSMAFTTQSPNMFCTARSICKKIYPNPEMTELPVELREKAVLLMSEDEREPTFNPVTGVAKGLFRGYPLYGAFPRCHDSRVNAWFEEVLEVQDDQTKHGFLFIGEEFR